MKKKILSLVFAAFAGMGAYAQNYYYLMQSGTTTDYSMLNTGTIILAQGSNDVLSTAQTIPFAFNYYGSAVTEYKASDNGYLTFDNAETSSISANVSIPSASAPKNAIFAFWDALEMKAITGSSVKTEVRKFTYGTAPNRVHVIQWFTASQEGVAAGSSNYSYFAVRLFEAGNFDIVYNDASPNSAAFTGTMGCQNSTGTTGTMIGGPSADFPNRVGSSGNANDKVYKFIYGTQPVFDLSVTKLNIAPYAALNVNVVIAGTISNPGATAITSFKLNYAVDGGAVISQNVTGVNIGASGGTYAFAHSTPYKGTTVGVKNIKVWASNLNGANADVNTSNDTLGATTTVVSQLGHRRLLHEVFSSSTCGPCAPGNVNMTNIVNAKSINDYTVIKYQQDFPGTGDPYCTSESVTRRSSTYAINSIPRMELDGGWDGNAGSYTSALFDQYQTKPAILDIYAVHTITGQTIKVDVMIKPYADIANSTKLYIAVLEKDTYQNKKTNGETVFHHVLKKMLPAIGGTTVTAMTAGSTKTFTQTYTFPGTFRLPVDGQSANRINLNTEHSVEEFSDLEVVVFLQHATTKEVYNSNWSVLNGNLSVKQPANVNTVNVYPNPANNYVMVDFNLVNNDNITMEIMDITGRVILSENKGELPSGDQSMVFSTSDLSNGVYFVTIKGANGFTSTQKFIISR